MSKPGFDLILGTDTLRELEIILVFLMKKVAQMTHMPMRDILKLSIRAMIDRAWIANNIVIIHEPMSAVEATQRVIRILDAKYKKHISM